TQLEGQAVTGLDPSPRFPEDISRLFSQIPFGFGQGVLVRYLCWWDRILACVGKPEYPARAGRNSSKEGPDETTSGPSSAFLTRELGARETVPSILKEQEAPPQNLVPAGGSTE